MGMWYKETVLPSKNPYFILFLFDKDKLNDQNGQT